MFSFSPLSDIKLGSKVNSDSDKLFIKQLRKHNKTTAETKIKKHPNKNTISTTSLSKVLSDENSNNHNYNHVTNRYSNYITSKHDVNHEHDNDHIVSNMSESSS
ncbi:20197_t:CDS:1, partial [Cetraspora pellucida]